MGLLIFLIACWLLWKVGILALKFVGFIVVLLLIGFFVHILLWPAICVAVAVLGYGLLTN